jgi:hypothetical protein
MASVRASDWASNRASDLGHTHCTLLKLLFFLFSLNYYGFFFDIWPYLPF